ncbi:MAG: hypothetical protein Q8P03_01440 [bacterium]|nr:hypothetical protein [bacterium]
MKTFAIIITIVLGIFIIVSPAQAAGGLIPCGGPDDPCNLCDLFGLGTNIINFFLFPGSTNNGFAIVPLIASFLFVVGGFTMLTAAGSPERTGRGKTILTTTVIGLIIVYASWIFVNTIFQAMGVAEWAGLGNWWQISCGVQ